MWKLKILLSVVKLPPRVSQIYTPTAMCGAAISIRDGYRVPIFFPAFFFFKWQLILISIFKIANEVQNMFYIFIATCISPIFNVLFIAFAQFSSSLGFLKLLFYKNFFILSQLVRHEVGYYFVHFLAALLEVRSNGQL